MYVIRTPAGDTVGTAVTIDGAIDVARNLSKRKYLGWTLRVFDKLDIRQEELRVSMTSGHGTWMDACRKCDGTGKCTVSMGGWMPGYKQEDCLTCHASGRVEGLTCE